MQMGRSLAPLPSHIEKQQQQPRRESKDLFFTLFKSEKNLVDVSDIFYFFLLGEGEGGV